MRRVVRGGNTRTRVRLQKLGPVPRGDGRPDGVLMFDQGVHVLASAVAEVRPARGGCRIVLHSGSVNENVLHVPPEKVWRLVREAIGDPS